MERETKLSSAEQQLLSLILPAGLLDYFEIKSVHDIKIGYEVLLEDRSLVRNNNLPICTKKCTFVAAKTTNNNHVNHPINNVFTI